MAVIGLGVIGLELGQACQRLGVQVTGIDQLKIIGNLDDPKVNETAIHILGKEMPLWLGHPASIKEAADGKLRVSAGERHVEVDFVIETPRRVYALEVKSGKPERARGLEKFCQLYPEAVPVLIGRGGIELEEFFSQEPAEILSAG